MNDRMLSMLWIMKWETTDLNQINREPRERIFMLWIMKRETTDLNQIDMEPRECIFFLYFLHIIQIFFWFVPSWFLRVCREGGVRLGVCCSMQYYRVWRRRRSNDCSLAHHLSYRVGFVRSNVRLTGLLCCSSPLVLKNYYLKAFYFDFCTERRFILDEWATDKLCVRFDSV